MALCKFKPQGVIKLGETMPMFLAWLVSWAALFLYLWRLESMLRSLEGKLKHAEDEGKP